MNVFERTWKMIKENPMAAFAIFEGLSFGAGAIFPESTRSFTDALRFKDRQVPVQGPLRAAPRNYGQLTGGSRSLGSRSMARTGIFGNTSGALYDIQKGIGGFLAAPIDLGRRFSPWADSGATGWNYLTGKDGATWEDVKGAVRTDLGLTDKSAGDISGFLAESFLGEGGAGGGGGSPRGGRGQKSKLGHKNFPGYGSQIERMKEARQTRGYGPNQLRAIALAFNDTNLRQVNRETGKVKTNKQTISLNSRLRQLS